MRGDIRDQVAATITEVARNATEEEKQMVASLVNRAKAHADNPDIVFEKITPGMAALLFLNHNTFNREWRPDWTAVLAKIMRDGGWRRTPQGYALYGEDGAVGDGSHRLGAQAYSGITLVMPIYLGMAKSDVGALDLGKPRTAADLGTLRGVVNAKEKTGLLKLVWAYEKAVGIPVPVLEQDLEAVVVQVKENEVLLNRALEIGQVSRQDLESDAALLTERAAAKVIAILLRHHWPEARVAERIDEIQTSDFASDDAPLAAARRFIEKHRKPDDTISPERETGVVIKGMILAETRQTLNQRGRNEISNAMKHPPDPSYPLADSATADD